MAHYRPRADRVSDGLRRRQADLRCEETAGEGDGGEDLAMGLFTSKAEKERLEKLAELDHWRKGREVGRSRVEFSVRKIEMANKELLIKTAVRSKPSFWTGNQTDEKESYLLLCNTIRQRLHAHFRILRPRRAPSLSDEDNWNNGFELIDNYKYNFMPENRLAVLIDEEWSPSMLIYYYAPMISSTAIWRIIRNYDPIWRLSNENIPDYENLYDDLPVKGLLPLDIVIANRKQKDVLSHLRIAVGLNDSSMLVWICRYDLGLVFSPENAIKPEVSQEVGPAKFPDVYGLHGLFSHPIYDLQNNEDDWSFDGWPHRVLLNIPRVARV